MSDEIEVGRATIQVEDGLIIERHDNRTGKTIRVETSGVVGVASDHEITDHSRITIRRAHPMNDLGLGEVIIRAMAGEMFGGDHMQGVLFWGIDANTEEECLMFFHRKTQAAEPFNTTARDYSQPYYVMGDAEFMEITQGEGLPQRNLLRRDDAPQLHAIQGGATA